MTDPAVNLGQLPHCDAAVLHAPGACDYCDRHPDWQELRATWGIAYTGQPPTDDQLPCPSDYRRGTDGAHVWPGNIPAVQSSSGPARFPRLPPHSRRPRR